MYLENYKTDEQKRRLINRHFTKTYLFDMFKDAEIDISDCKTKKDILDKHLKEAWELVCEEFDLLVKVLL